MKYLLQGDHMEVHAFKSNLSKPASHTLDVPEHIPIRGTACTCANIKNLFFVLSISIIFTHANFLVTWFHKSIFYSHEFTFWKLIFPQTLNNYEITSNLIHLKQHSISKFRSTSIDFILFGYFFKLRNFIHLSLDLQLFLHNANF